MRIVAADIPQHADHLAMALALATAVSLGIAFLVVMQPRTERMPTLERARIIRFHAAAESERRRATAPLVLEERVLEERAPSAPQAPPTAPAMSARNGGFICRTPDRAAVQRWFHDRVRPLLLACIESAHGGSTRGSLTLTFDEVGLVKRAALAHVSDAFVACATPKLARLAHPDAYELTFTWPFVVPH